MTSFPFFDGYKTRKKNDGSLRIRYNSTKLACWIVTREK